MLISECQEFISHFLIWKKIHDKFIQENSCASLRKMRINYIIVLKRHNSKVWNKAKRESLNQTVFTQHQYLVDGRVSVMILPACNTEDLQLWSRVLFECHSQDTQGTILYIMGYSQSRRATILYVMLFMIQWNARKKLSEQ